MTDWGISDPSESFFHNLLNKGNESGWGGNPPTPEGRPPGWMKKGGIKGEKGGFANPAPGFSPLAPVSPPIYIH
jgi:hypothetical protein